MTIMTNIRTKTSPEAEYDEILRKLDALLLRHQGKPSVSAQTDANEAQQTAIAGGRSAQISLTAADNIPTLTELVYLPPSMVSPPGDITSLIAQIVDSALKDAGADLGAGARTALVQALESRLFGL
jgi:hypothetical protein